MPDEATAGEVPPARPRWRPRSRAWVAVAVAGAAVLAAAAAVCLAWPSPPSPRYSAFPDPCGLVSAADIGRYAPGAQESPPSVVVYGGTVSGTCNWSAGSTSIGVWVTLYAAAADAAGAVAPQGAARNTQPVAGLGDRALVYEAVSGAVRSADLTAQSGNAVIVVSYGAPAGSRDAAAVRSAATALAGVALAALPAAPAAGLTASGFPASARPGTPYARPASACDLVPTALLAGSLPGAAADPGEAASLTAGSSGTADCGWTAAGGTLRVDVAVLGPAPAASPCPAPRIGAGSIAICSPASSGFASFYGPGGSVQHVSGLGDQASAYLGGTAGSPLIVLTVDSGNAVVTVNLLRNGQLARAAQLAETTAIARGVLGALPRSR